MPERDPLDALRGAWSSLEAPDPTPEVGDAQTEAAVGWLREAWQAVEAPAPVLPRELRRSPWQLRLVRARPVLAAAAVLVLCAVFLRGPRELALTPRVTEEMAQVPDEPASPATLAPRREVVEGAPEDGLVLEHGSVRLVLLDPIEERLANELETDTEPERGFGETQEN